MASNGTDGKTEGIRMWWIRDDEVLIMLLTDGTKVALSHTTVARMLNAFGA